MIRRLLTSAVLLSCSLVALPVLAQSEAPATDDHDFSVMHVLADHGLHQLSPERWNAYGQVTYISSFKAGFSAPYGNLNGSTKSLSAEREHSFTATATLYLGLALWPGAELYLAPEVISSRALSELAGLGASIQNFELQKQGQIAPTIYFSRTYLTQTLDLGGALVERDSGALQLGSTVHRRRLVLVLGNLSILDYFDKNSITGDPRKGFFSIAFMTHGAYDFAADSRGYTWGGLFELHLDDWALRVGRFTPPKDPNGLDLDFRVLKYYADQAELEHVHHVLGQPGAVRLLGYRNRENMGAFTDAVGAFQRDPALDAGACTSYNYGSQNPNAPDLCWVRKPHVKFGLGVSFEQQLSDDVGVFARAMVADGRTEVYSYTSSDRSASLGAVVHGSAWHRPYDTAGVGLAASWISSAHAQYLSLGGIDGFIGDGKLNRASERVIELLYNLHVYRSLLVSADYQHISNPAYNADRGPVNVLAGRVHAEF